MTSDAGEARDSTSVAVYSYSYSYIYIFSARFELTSAIMHSLGGAARRYGAHKVTCKVTRRVGTASRVLVFAASWLADGLTCAEGTRTRGGATALAPRQLPRTAQFAPMALIAGDSCNARSRFQGRCRRGHSDNRKVAALKSDHAMLYVVRAPVF